MTVSRIPQREKISAQERRVQDRKHLDDVTAATLPPLHHSGAVMLSLEESANLLQEQMRKKRVSGTHLSLRYKQNFLFKHFEYMFVIEKTFKYFTDL